MTKDEWKNRYTQRMIAAGVDEKTATEAGQIGVELQEESDGPNVDTWYDPETAAEDEMSYWEPEAE